MVKNVIITVLLALSLILGVNIVSEYSKFLKTKELIECYDRIVNQLPDSIFINYVSNTIEWKNLEDCVERNHIGCGCSKDIMPYEQHILYSILWD